MLTASPIKRPANAYGAKIRYGEFLFHFVVRLPVHPLGKLPTTHVTVEVAALLQVIQGDMPRPALQAAMGLRNAEHFRKAYLVPAMAAGYLEMTLPDTPRSTRQRYRLTPLGLQRQRELKDKS
jgi:ATP-dependent DNA helicase RecG